MYMFTGYMWICMSVYGVCVCANDLCLCCLWNYVSTYSWCVCVSVYVHCVFGYEYVYDVCVCIWYMCMMCVLVCVCMVCLHAYGVCMVCVRACVVFVWYVHTALRPLVCVWCISGVCVWYVCMTCMVCDFVWFMWAHSRVHMQSLGEEPPDTSSLLLHGFLELNSGFQGKGFIYLLSLLWPSL